MPELEKGKVTICVVNYKTLDLTRLCLRSIRKYTDYPCEVIVVDNGSADASLDYLRSLHWITLIERSSKDDPSGGYSHAAALDLGLERCRTEFFVSMHSDTFVMRSGWLGDLILRFEGNERIACVGSGKLELEPAWQTWMKGVTDLRSLRRRLLRTPDPQGKHRCYNRTICCLYRTDVLRKEGLSFMMGKQQGVTAGKKLYFELVDRGYGVVELPAGIMGRYVIHLAHATQVTNPGEFRLDAHTTRKCHRLVDKVMSSPAVQAVLRDGSLDM